MTVLTSAPPNVRSCSICFTLAPTCAIVAASSANPPGRSEITAVNCAMRSSSTTPRSITRVNIMGSILPPHNTMATRLPCSEFNFPAKNAAKPTAPAPSTTPFSNSRIRKMAKAICSSRTVTTSSTRSRAKAKARSPTCGTAKPSANVAPCHASTG